MLPESVRVACEHSLNVKLRRSSRVGGGDINEARLLDTSQGLYFLKMNVHPAAFEMFQTEAAGLEAIRKTQTIATPTVFSCQQLDDIAFIVLAYIESGPKTKKFWKDFGVALARMHQKKQAYYGFPEDNFIGLLPQPNPRMENWVDFYRDARLQTQIELAGKNHRMETTDYQSFDRLLNRLSELLPEEHPSLIHGDLWSGNFIADLNEEGALIDPASCYAHREMDIAMSKLFGGFSPVFYEAYQQTFPLLEGWRERIPLYQLYYLMAHVNLFGGSYLPSVRQILRRFS